MLIILYTICFQMDKREENNDGKRFAEEPGPEVQ